MIPSSLMNQYSYPTNSTFNQSNAKHIRNPSGSIDPKDLISNSTDDLATLLTKNKRLVQLVVQSSAKIAELHEARKYLEEEHNVEKQEWLYKLEKITANYKTYAESYQNYVAIKEDFEAMDKEFKHTKQIGKHYEVVIKNALTEILSCYKKVNFFLNSDKLINSVDLSKDYFNRTKDDLKEKLFDLSAKIDPYTFEDLFQEVRNV